jgi:cysteine synthase
MQVARRVAPTEHAVIVTIFPDSGEKYLSDHFWTEE